MGQWDLMLFWLSLCFTTSPMCLPPIWDWICVSPPFPLPTLAFLFLTELFFLLQGYRQELEPTSVAEPLWEIDLFWLFFGSRLVVDPSLLADHRRGCYVCLSSRIDLQTWPTRVLSCPTARRRGIPEGRRHVGTDGRGPLHRRLLL